MREARPDAKKVATVSAVLFLLLFAGVLYHFDASYDALFNSVTKSGAVLTVIGLFWVFYEKWGWRWRATQLFGWLCSTPDLQGRWEGTVCRDGQQEIEHKFVLEISQTFSGLKFRTFGEKSRGESVSVLLVSKDDQDLMWEAYCIWQSSARQIERKDERQYFFGASMWKISVDPKSRDASISDVYFTSRQTSGQINIRRVSKELKGTY